MNEASGRLGRARFLRLGWFRLPIAVDVTGPSHGSRAAVTIGGNDVSGYLATATLKRTLETTETTGLLSTAKSIKADSLKASLEFTGFFDPAIQSNLKAIDRSTTSWSYSPAGTATGFTTYSGTATLNLHKTSSKSTDANRLEGELQVVGTVTPSTN